jgi:antitoxin component YwqK of YwqJK toxin-antitoxin module
MKNKYFLLLLPILLFSCSEKEIEYQNLQERNGLVYQVNKDKPYTGKTSQKLTDGTLILLGGFNKGKKNGEWIEFARNGQKLKVQNYDDSGNYDGIVEEYNNKGQILNRQNFKGGKRDGAFEYYFKDGSKKMTGEYRNEKLHATVSEWYKNQKRKSIINYSEGKKDGNEEIYSENGQITRKASYINDKLDGKLTEYYTSGKPRTISEYKNGKVNGKYTTYYKNGNKDIEYNQDNGNFSGIYTEYNQDGSIHRQYDYKKSGKVNYGTWKKYWTKDWNVVKEPSTYYSSVSFDINGKPSTRVKYYYQKNNKIQSEQSYFSVEPDVQQGEAIWYSESGGITMKGNFNNGKRDGSWTTYYKSDNYVGNKTKEKATYSIGKLKGNYTFYAGGKDFDNPASIIGNRYQTIWGYWKVTANILSNFSETEYKIWVIFEDSHWDKGPRCKYKMDYYVKHINKKYSKVNSYIKQNNGEYYDINNNKQWRIKLKDYKRSKDKLSCK